MCRLEVPAWPLIFVIEAADKTDGTLENNTNTEKTDNTNSTEKTLVTTSGKVLWLGQAGHYVDIETESEEQGGQTWAGKTLFTTGDAIRARVVQTRQDRSKQQNGKNTGKKGSKL